MRTARRISTVATAATITAVLVLTGCGANNESGQQPTAGVVGVKKAGGVDESAPQYSKLPKKFQENGKIVSAYNGQYPPYVMFKADNETLEGASEDLRVGLERQLGVPIETSLVNSLPTLLTGMQSGRYELSVGPTGDTPDKRGKVDFVDYVDSRGAFVTPKGNPLKFASLNDICGYRVAAVTGGSAERIMQDFAAKCPKQGKPEAKLLSFQDQNTMVLSVQSGQADAAYSGLAVLSYFQQQSGGKLELVPEPKDIGLGVVPQGVIVPKDSALAPVVLEAMQALFDDGTYAKIMEKWHLTDLMIDKPEINLAK